MNVLAIIVLLSVLIFNAWVAKDWLYPAFIHAFIWLVVVVCVQISSLEYGQLSDITYLIITTGATAFSLGSLQMKVRKNTPIKANNLNIQGIPKRSVIIYLFAISSLLFPFFLLRAIFLVSLVGSGNFFNDLRVSVVYNDLETGGYGILQYGIVISNFAASASIFRATNSNNPTKLDNSLAWISCILALFYAILSSGRTAILTFLVTTFGSLVILRKFGLIKIIVLGLLPFFLFFISIGFIRNLASSESGIDSDSFNQVLTNLVEYFLGGVFAFDQLLNSPETNSFIGENVFRIFYKFLELMGANVQVKPLLQPYVEYPIRANIYTFYQPYYLDFGIIGAIFAQYIVGFIHGSLYRKIILHKIKSFNVFLYSCLLYPLLMQFFQDQYFSLISQWMQFLLGGWIMFKIGVENQPVCESKIHTPITSTPKK